VAAAEPFLPGADETLSEHVVVTADPARTYEAIGGTDISSDRVVAMLSGLDDARLRLAGRPRASRTLDRLLAMDAGPVELSREPGVRRAVGVIGRYHLFERSLVHVSAAAFEAFDEPGYLKGAAVFTLTPQADGRTLLGCELRVLATDEDMRSTLASTWFVVGAGLRFAVRRLLDAIRAEAERRALRSGAERAENRDAEGDHDDAGDLHPA
jgi:hypothetical protein